LLSEQERQEAISKLSDTEALALIYDWRGFWARSNQLPPSDKWFIWLLLSGRGFGKTRIGAETVRQWAYDGYTPIALVGQSKADVRDTMIEVGESSILNISPPNFKPAYEPSKRRLTWPNGVQAIVYSGDEPDQLRGPQHMKVWCDELAKFQYPQATWDNLMLGLRIGSNPQALVTTTPRPLQIIKDIVKDTRAVVTRGHTLDNALNLAPQFLDYVMSKYEGTKLGRQELAGEILDSMEGLVYDCFRPEVCVIPRFAIPQDWPRFTGHDFGISNTACLWYALEPATGYYYLYRTYHQAGGLAEHAENFKSLSTGEPIRRRVGGNHQEQEIRDGYAFAGWPILEPSLRHRETQIQRVYGHHNQNRIYVFIDCHDYLEEKLSFSYEVDKDDNLDFSKIHNEAKFHFMACERYLFSDIQPMVDNQTSSKIPVLTYSGSSGRLPKIRRGYLV